ncbi:NADH oxidase 3 [Podospora australis]|uniref:NADH oxidase 3 n=1 Tax=Podospora australis TaxID=1536484 RepID=A0AAN7AL83_9PEZI|nr:NADH oxidase 3 [Podospora australis]
MTSDLQLAQPLTLRCGLTLPNRLAKASLNEKGADNATQLPSEKLLKISSAWSDGGWGMLMTGAILMDPTHTGKSDVVTSSSPSHVVSEEAQVKSLAAWADSYRSKNGYPSAPVIIQICHPGRQSMRGEGTRGFWGLPVAPSAIPLNLGDGLFAKVVRYLLFPAPREITLVEIQEVVREFAFSAKVAAKAGFEGMEIHAAHGFLLSQFMSASGNRRTDAYGGSPAKRARIIVEVVRAVREATKDFKNFAVGIKVNSVDHQEKGELAETIEQLKLIADAGVDFIEISGGSFEDMSMMASEENPSSNQDQRTERTKAREAFFLEFAKAIRREIPALTLMVTGGFTTRAGMERAVAQGDCDIVGLGRPSIMHPHLPREIILNPSVKDEDARLFRAQIPIPWLLKQTRLKVVGAGVDNKFYFEKLQELGGGGPSIKK